MFSAPSLRIASPCSKFAARFPRARAASLETKGEEDPSALFKGFSRKCVCGGGWLVWWVQHDRSEQELGRMRQSMGLLTFTDRQQQSVGSIVENQGVLVHSPAALSSRECPMTPFWGIAKLLRQRAKVVFTSPR